MPANSFLNSDTLAEFAGRFDGATLQRGRAYAGEGRVRVRHVERATGEIHVEAEVQGTRKHPYEVDLWLELDPGGAIVDVDNSCMCPMRENCKHVVATLLNLGETTDIGRFGGNGNASARDDAGYPEPSPATLDWLDALDQAPVRTVPAKASGARVVYLLRPGSPPSLTLGKSRPLKKGGAGKPAVYRPQPYDLGSTRSRDFILDEDIAPLRLFLALQAGGGYFYNEAVDLTGETGALLLRLALRTGRLYLDGLVELPLESGAPRPLRMSWAHNLAGLQQLAFDLPPALQLIPTWPPFYLDTAAGLVGELQSDLSARLLQQLMTAPHAERGRRAPGA
jgi:hypothetical protein